MRIKYRPYRYEACTSSDGLIYSGRFSFEFDSDFEFITGKRRAGLLKLFRDKGIYVKTGKGKAQKLLIGIGLHTLSLSKVSYGKTKNGYAKCTVSFHKSPKESWFNNSDLSYCTIDGTHLLTNRGGGDFSKSWYLPFTNQFSKEDFETLRQGTKYKCIVQHRERQWTNNGIPMRYQQGSHMGELIIRVEPEVVAVYDIETPDEDIDIPYFKLYKPVK